MPPLGQNWYVEQVDQHSFVQVCLHEPWTVEDELFLELHILRSVTGDAACPCIVLVEHHL
jgi:hypothetical protein